MKKHQTNRISGGWIHEYTSENSNFEKIYNFFQILNKIIEPDRLGILEALSDDTFVIDLFWDDMQIDYFRINNFINENDDIDDSFIHFDYEIAEYCNFFINEHTIKERKITYPEFYMLMQIFFWVYQKEEYYHELLENEKNWKYSEIENIQWKNRGKYDEKRLEEFFILQLMKKDISGAFGPIYEKDENWENTEKILFEWIKVQKIFDKNWSEEKQQKSAKEINELFGDEIVITEE